MAARSQHSFSHRQADRAPDHLPAFEGCFLAIVLVGLWGLCGVFRKCCTTRWNLGSWVGSSLDFAPASFGEVQAMSDFKPPLYELREHAEAIGFVCIHWAHMEMSLDSLLSCLAPLEGGSHARL